MNPSLLLIQLGTFTAVGLGYSAAFSTVRFVVKHRYRVPAFFGPIPLTCAATSIRDNVHIRHGAQIGSNCIVGDAQGFSCPACGLAYRITGQLVEELDPPS